MITTTRVAAVAGSLAAAAAVAAAIVLPVHHTPVRAATSGLTAGAVAAKTGDSPGAQPSPGSGTSGSAGPSGPTGAGSGSAGGSSGSGPGSGSGAGSGSAQGSGHGSGSGNGSGSGSGSSPSAGATTVPSPTGTIGNPNAPCLIGYVWRQAFHGDYVCVTPATRAQAAADDAAANGRIQQGGGAYGPYTCVQGYVWRQVVPDDYTCVSPAVRSQAAYDNSQAANRVALLHLCVTAWSQGSAGPYIQVDGDLFNFGSVLLEVRRSSDGAVLWSQQITATSYAGLPGAAFYAQTPVLQPSATTDYYVTALDVASGRWSNQVPLSSYCV